MTQSEIVDVVSRKTGLPRKTVALVLTVFVSETLKALAAGERVLLRGFGVFSKRQLAERTLFGGARTSKRRWSVRFTTSRKVRGL